MFVRVVLYLSGICHEGPGERACPWPEKAALHRGRVRLRELSETVTPLARQRAVSPAVARYAALFNARDWDGVRAMLIDDVKLDLVSRLKWTGRRQVSDYLTNYDGVSDWRLFPGWLDGREVLAVFRQPGDVRPGYFIELTLIDDRVSAIRDFRYVPYIGQEATIALGVLSYEQEGPRSGASTD